MLKLNGWKEHKLQINDDTFSIRERAIRVVLSSRDTYPYMFGHAGTVAFTIEIKPLLKYIIEIEVGNVFH